MVVFEGGAPKKSDYRRFRIRGDRIGAGPTTSPRWRRCCAGGSRATLEQADRSPHDAERDESFAALPDLIVIDGGKGQLSAGMRRRSSRSSSGAVTVIGLAKRLEEVYVPGPLGAAADPDATPRRCGCCSGSATRRTASRSTSTAPAATRR